jgi:hypothetical protein
MKSLIAVGLIVFLPASKLAAQDLSTPRSDWTRVQSVEAGVPLIVTVKGSPPVTRVFVAADASSLVMLNLSNPALSSQARDALRTAARDQPRVLVDDPLHGSVLVGRDLRLESNGVFLLGNRIARLGDIIERTPRTDVAEIRTEAQGSLGATALGAGLGAVGGFFGGLVLGPVFDPNCHCSDQGLRGAIVGSIVGMIAGGTGGAIALRHAAGKTSRVIYHSAG